MEENGILIIMYRCTNKITLSIQQVEIQTIFMFFSNKVFLFGEL